MIAVDAHPQEIASVPESRSRLEDVYVRHWPDSFRLAYLLTGDRAAAEDLVHDAFVRIAGRFAHLRSMDNEYAYLRRVITNLHTSRLRRLRLERRYVAERRRRIEVSTQPDIPGRKDLWDALGDLPPRQRAALVLRYYEDLPERESADVLRCSVAAVRSLVQRGIGTLRSRKEGWEA